MADTTPHLSSTLHALWQTMLASDANLQAGMQRIAEAGCGLLSNCAGASITVIENNRPTTVARSNDLAVLMDETQYRVHQGPCLSAALENRTIHIEDVSTERRWPEFVTVAAKLGVGSSLSIPLQAGGASFSAGLNIYGNGPDAFDDNDMALATAFAAQASSMVANTLAYWAAFDMSRNLTVSIESRGVIEQAKGILMGTLRMTADDAFRELRTRSQAENRKVRDIAAEIVEGATAGGEA